MGAILIHNDYECVLVNFWVKCHSSQSWEPTYCPEEGGGAGNLPALGSCQAGRRSRRDVLYSCIPNCQHMHVQGKGHVGVKDPGQVQEKRVEHITSQAAHPKPRPSPYHCIHSSPRTPGEHCRNTEKKQRQSTLWGHIRKFLIASCEQAWT